MRLIIPFVIYIQKYALEEEMEGKVQCSICGTVQELDDAGLKVRNIILRKVIVLLRIQDF